MELKILRGEQLEGSALAEQIMDLDRKNMQPVLEQAGIAFPVEKRRKGLASDSTFIVAFDGQRLAGYLDYLRSWTNPDYIYIGSVQIEAEYRGGGLLLMLLEEFRTLVAGEEFAGFETNVQKVNVAAVRLYRKIGFRLESNPRNDASWTARAGKELLSESPVAKLIDRWRVREASRSRCYNPIQL
jgi:ribosomal protein S18 acetylase RimI-like enzyme